MLKKIEIKSEKEKKKRTRNTIIGIVIVALMILSTLGYVIVDRNNADEGKTIYNGYEFEQTTQGWQTTLKSFNKAIVTTYLPGDVLNYNTSADLYYFNGKVIFIVVENQQDVQASYDVVRNLNDISERMQFACPNEAENSSFCQETNLPLKSCDDANSENSIIIINSNSTNVTSSFKNSCLTLEGQGSELVKLSDNFIFKIFNIIE